MALWWTIAAHATVLVTTLQYNPFRYFISAHPTNRAWFGANRAGPVQCVHRARGSSRFVSPIADHAGAARPAADPSFLDVLGLDPLYLRHAVEYENHSQLFRIGMCLFSIIGSTAPFHTRVAGQPEPSRTSVARPCRNPRREYRAPAGRRSGRVSSPGLLQGAGATRSPATRDTPQSSTTTRNPTPSWARSWTWGGVVEIRGGSVKELNESMRCLVDQRLRRPVRPSATPLSLEEWVARAYQERLVENESHFHYAEDVPGLIVRCHREPVLRARAASLVSSDPTDGA